MTTFWECTRPKVLLPALTGPQRIAAQRENTSRPYAEAVHRLCGNTPQSPQGWAFVLLLRTEIAYLRAVFPDDDAGFRAWHAHCLGKCRSE
jgi:hypothetical protein